MNNQKKRIHLSIRQLTFTASAPANAPVWIFEMWDHLFSESKKEKFSELSDETAFESNLVCVEYKNWVQPKYTTVEVYNATVAPSII